jgi:hypothetical protein
VSTYKPSDSAGIGALLYINSDIEESTQQLELIDKNLKLSVSISFALSARE